MELFETHEQAMMYRVMIILYDISKDASPTNESPQNHTSGIPIINAVGLQQDHFTYFSTLASESILDRHASVEKYVK